MGSEGPVTHRAADGEPALARAVVTVLAGVTVALCASCGVPRASTGHEPGPSASQPGPGAPFGVVVTGHEHTWRYRYPGPDAALGTADDRLASGDLHVPLQTRVDLELHSDDNLYFFGVPSLGLNQIAMRELTYTLTLGPLEIGTYDLLGDQMCGGAFPAMEGKLIVEPVDAFARWMESLTSFHALP